MFSNFVIQASLDNWLINLYRILLYMYLYNPEMLLHLQLSKKMDTCTKLFVVENFCGNMLLLFFTGNALHIFTSMIGFVCSVGHILLQKGG